MTEARRRWRTVWAVAAGMAAAGSVYYLYRSLRDEAEREDAEREVLGAAGLCERVHEDSRHTTPVANRTAGQQEQVTVAPAAEPATPVSEVRYMRCTLFVVKV